MRRRVSIRTSLLSLLLLLAPVSARAQNTISTLAGGGDQNGQSFKDLAQASSVVVDANGNIFISASAEHTVFIQNGAGLVVYAGVGFAGFSGDGGPATSAALNYPAGLAVDAAGNLFIADSYNNRIRRVDANTQVITTVAGSSNITGPFTGQFGGDGGQATAALLSQPSGVAFDAAGNLLICDTFNSVIRSVNASTQIITTIIGNPNARGTPGQGNGDGGAVANALLNLPSRVAVSGGSIFIADVGDNEIRQVINGNIFDAAGSGAFGTPGANNGDGGLARNAQLNSPNGMAADAGGNILVADTGDHVIRELTPGPNGFVISTVVGNGTEGLAGDSGSPGNASLNFPNDVFVDATGNIFIADTGNQRVREVTAGPTPPPTISTLGNEGGSGGDLSFAQNAILAAPGWVAIDADGNLLISDSANYRIRKVTAPTTTVPPPQIGTVAGLREAGESGDGGAASAATFNSYPVIFPGIEFFSFGLLAGQMSLDSAGDIFVVDTGGFQVRRIDATSGIVTTVAGNGTQCFGLGCGDGGPAAQAGFNLPIGVAVDAAGNIYISDFNTQIVRKVDGTTGNISTFAGNGQICADSTTACGDGGPAAQANLGEPAGLLIDANGNLLIADSFDSKIRLVPPSGATISTIAFNGTGGNAGDGGPALQASMDLPTALAIDATGNIFVSSNITSSVRRIDAAAGTISTVAGPTAGFAGIRGFAGDGGLATQAAINNEGIAVDGAENLYIADAGNNRIRVVPLTPTLAQTGNFAAFNNQPVGATSAAQTVTIQNVGGATLTFTQIAVSGAGFAQTNTCPASLAPLQSCTVSVTFAPAGIGNVNGLLTLPSNAPTVADPLSGTGVSGGIATLNPGNGGTLGFGNEAVDVPSTAKPVTLTNNGTGALGFQSATVTFANGQTAQFTASNNCPASVPPAPQPGSTCTINLTFLPTVAGNIAQTLTVATDDPNNGTESVNLTGTGIASGVANLSSAVVDFGGQLVNSTSNAIPVTVTNKGTGPLNITGVTPSGDFADTTGCITASPLAVNATCTINITFTPTVIGARAGTIQVASDATNGAQTINLTGSGTSFSLGLAPGAGPSLTVNPGATAVFPLQLTSTPGFTGTVGISCTNLTATISCVVTPTSIVVSGQGTTRTAISVETFCRAWLAPPIGGGRRTPRRMPPVLWLYAIALGALLGSICLLRPRRLRLALSLASLLIVVGLGASCGGDPGPVGKTLPGSYPLMITASLGQATSTVNLTLNVN